MAPSEDSSSSPSRNREYAGFFRRFLAYVVDGFILSLIGGTLGYSFNATVHQAGGQQQIYSSISVIIAALYFVFFWAKQNGQTLGQRLVAIKVIKEDGKPVDIPTGIVRYIGLLIAFVPFALGHLWIIWDGKKQGWQDKIAKTVVVKTGGKSHTGVAITIFVISIVFFILIIILFGSAALLAFRNPQIASQLSKDYPQLKESLKVTQAEADRHADNTFGKVNEYRKQHNLPQFTVTQPLCAYALRRLDQQKAYGGYDERKGFYEDTANQQMVNAYFQKYATVNETGYSPLSTVTTADNILKSWEAQSDDSPLKNKAYTDGCIRANEQTLVFIVGAPK